MNDIIANPCLEAQETVTIQNQRGLHARAAAKFVKVASKFDCVVEVTKADTKVSGTSIMGLMMLAASKGTSLHISACGSDAVNAVHFLVNLINNKFDEGE